MTVLQERLSLLPNEDSPEVKNALFMTRMYYRHFKLVVYVKAHTRRPPEQWKKKGPKPIPPDLLKRVEVYGKSFQKDKVATSVLVKV